LVVAFWAKEEPKIETEEDAAIFSICCAFVVVLLIAIAILADWGFIIIVGLESLAAILFLAGIAHSKDSVINAGLFLFLLALPTLFFALIPNWKIVTGLSFQVILPIIVLLKSYLKFHKAKKFEKARTYVMKEQPFLYDDLLRGPEDIHSGPPSKKEVEKREHANS